jgi:hypothetical protein
MIKEMIKAHPTEIGCQGKQGNQAHAMRWIATVRAWQDETC